MAKKFIKNPHQFEIDMRVCSVDFVNNFMFDDERVPSLYERSGRICYNSMHLMDKSSAEPFIERILESGHFSVIELHGMPTVECTSSRGIFDEFARHRLTSFLAQSTRYIKDWRRFQFPAQFIGEDVPTKAIVAYSNSCYDTLLNYNRLIETGLTNENARDVLTLGLSTRFTAGSNVRQWLYVINHRTQKGAHLGIRYLMSRILDVFVEHPNLRIFFEPLLDRLKKEDRYVSVDINRERLGVQEYNMVD